MQSREICEFIAKLRADHDLTQAQFAELAGVEQTTIGRIEAGMPPRIETLNKILAALGYSIEIVAVEA